MTKLSRRNECRWGLWERGRCAYVCARWRLIEHWDCGSRRRPTVALPEAGRT